MKSSLTQATLEREQKKSLDTNRNDISIYLIGDSGVGKTSLLKTYTTRKTGYTDIGMNPTIVESYELRISLGDKKVSVRLWDSSGDINFVNIRQLVYDTTEETGRAKNSYILLCYDISSPSTLANIARAWLPEIREQNFLMSHILLVGLKSDVDKDALRRSVKNLMRNGFMGHSVCSIYDLNSIDDVFKAVYSDWHRKKERPKGKFKKSIYDTLGRTLGRKRKSKKTSLKEEKQEEDLPLEPPTAIDEDDFEFPVENKLHHLLKYSSDV